MTPRSTIPVFVTYRDRRAMLDRCIASLLGYGWQQGDITVIDNGSEIPLTHAMLSSFIPGHASPKINIVRSDNAHRQLAPWALGLVPKDSYYIVMDGDVELDAPSDVAEVLIHALERNPSITKLGLSIRTDDWPWPLPERYWYSYLMEYGCNNRNRFKILDKGFEMHGDVLPAIIDAPVDTHFAMHRPGSDWGGITGARTLAPYLCRHLPWYNLDYTEEEKLYYRRAGEEWTGTHSGETLLAPKVVVPFTQLHAETVAALAESGIPPADLLYRPMLSDTAYCELLHELWADGRTFIVVEHDIVVTPDTIPEFLACPHDWCAMAYPYRGEAKAWGLACTKFSASLIARFPDLMAEVGGMQDAKHALGHWCRMDAWIWDALTRRGVSRCEHQGTVGHLGGQFPVHGCLER